MADDTRDLVIKTRAELDALALAFGKTEKKVDEMHNLLTQAKGARWASLILLTTLASIGGFLANVIVTFFNPPPH